MLRVPNVIIPRDGRKCGDVKERVAFAYQFQERGFFPYKKRF